MYLLVKLSQYETFSETIDVLTRKGKLQKNDKLLSLNPFLDEHNILRVGGRLENSSFTFEKKHPAILHAKHRLTLLIFEREHARLLHAGPRALLCSIRERFWPIAGQNLSKQIVRRCIKCCRYDSKSINPIMGNLPKERIQRMLPFQTTGVDFAGPFSIKTKNGRGGKLMKGYIAVFVCFTTKALHLELVTSLTKDAFIATLRRFVARRGCPTNIYSDNGTNFTGAYSELKELGKFLKNNQKEIQTFSTNLGLQWHFIPARSPHFGGIWEAGVKVVKFHLKRVLNNAFLNFEDFYSLIVQIESILNSRPITPLSNSPNDLTPLTPAHFLIGRTFTELPDPDLEHIQTNRLSQYQRIQQLKQNFWRRWSKEYISEMQQRSKWKIQAKNLKINDMVIVKEDNLHPANWMLGRVIDLHPGADNIVRVVTIKTCRGTIRRAVTKLCPLPVEVSD